MFIIKSKHYYIFGVHQYLIIIVYYQIKVLIYFWCRSCSSLSQISYVKTKYFTNFFFLSISYPHTHTHIYIILERTRQKRKTIFFWGGCKRERITMCAFELGWKIKIISLFSLFLLLFMGMHFLALFMGPLYYFN